MVKRALLALACLVAWIGATAQQQQMVWRNASDPLALCNDFTRAGFFIRRNTSSDRWVIFLEGGSLCFSSGTCNRRFFRSEFRSSSCDFAGTGSSTSAQDPFGTFDPTAAYNCLRRAGTPYSGFVNPLMTSMRCLDRGLFGPDLSVVGQDLFDTDPNANNNFYAHNHVLIPYCSSDLWLGSEVTSQGECDCSNTSCFNYNPNSSTLQFAFRGKIIFQSIFQQLISDFGMSSASEIVMGGSSAGGLGALNLAQWVADNKPAGAELLLILDSMWFINFQDGIFSIFNGTTPQRSVQPLEDTPTLPPSNNTLRLFNILNSHSSCADTHLGFPCCVSAHCVFSTKDNVTGRLQHFPQSGVRTFIFGSVYDVFLLAPAVAGLDDFDSVTGGKPEGTTSLLIDLLRLIGEYGGQTNFTLSQTFNNAVPSVSYYLTQCFQHVYFATSSLWGSPGQSVFGDSGVELAQDLISFSHTIQPGRWNLPLSSGSLTIRDAISDWYNGTNRRFLDSCQGPYCNEMCPDRFTLGELTSNNWPTWGKVLIVACILGMAMLCLVMKMMFYWWLYWLEKKQDDYLESLDDGISDGAHLVFPHCPDSNLVAVSCLDLTYNVNFQANKHVKDERKDQTQAVVLHDLTEDEPASAPDNSEQLSKRQSRALRRRSRFSSLADNILRRSSAANSPMQPDPEKSLAYGVIPTPPPPPPLPVIIPEAEEVQYNSCGCQRTRNKEILRGISIYFNPGEMIGIMGPSGCGKTTLLDLLTGRRKSGLVGGNIYVNGIPMDELRDWYIANTGYVLQLATPYYEELTVRDNLMLAAQIKLPETKTFTLKDKFRRVEQVMEVTGLGSLADTVVGGEVGPGLSGGQKRRLVVALQLLRVPSVIFLDEPTSGLDATSSMELLSHLNKLAETKRTVILTIHQPRFEIFHMFHKLVLISDGRVAYHGAPEKAYEVFVNALRERYLEQGLIIPSLGDHNPADVIMDMLGNPRFRLVLTEYYQCSTEPKLVRHAVKVARWKGYSQSSSSMDSLGSAVGFAIFGAKKAGRRHAHTFTRMAALEARASKRLPFTKNIFLPFMFFAFALVLGTVYFQQNQAFLVVSGMCVFSVASGLFVFPTIELYYTPALRVYTYERADGVGRSQDLVLQGFIRYITIAFLPVIVATGIIYLLLINAAEYDVLVFLQVAVVNVALNLCWTALLISLMLALPKTAFRLSSLIASIFGFTSGFFIPIKDIPWWYRWISFINPNYYGFSSVAFFLLENFSSGCMGSELECYFTSGAFTLRQFFFDTVNPYLHLLILFGFTIFYLGLAWLVHWMRHTSVVSKLRRLVSIIFRKPTDELSKQIKTDRAEYERSISKDGSIDPHLPEGVEPGDLEELSPEETARTPLCPIPEEEEDEEEEETEPQQAADHFALRSKWQTVAEKSLEKETVLSTKEPSLEDSVTSMGSTGSGWGKVRRVRIQTEDATGDPKRPRDLNLKQQKRKNYRTPFLSEGETHMVWRPKKRPLIADLVERLQQSQGDEPTTPKPSTTTPPTPKEPKSLNNLIAPPVTRTPSLRSRQKTLFNRVIATQAVLKEHTDELLEREEQEEPRTRKMTLLEASKKVTASLKRQKSKEQETKNFSDIVTEFLSKAKASGEMEDRSKAEPPTSATSTSSASKWGNIANKKPALVKRDTHGAIRIQTLRELVREEKLHSSGGSDDSATKRRSAGAAVSPDVHTLSPVEIISVAEPPREVKLNKMAQLKKTVSERNQQKQSSSGQPGLIEVSEASANDPTVPLTGHDSLNTNGNNSNRTRTAQPTNSRELSGRRAISGDIQRPKTTPVASRPRWSSQSDIFVAKSSYPEAKDGARGGPINLEQSANYRSKSAKPLRRQHASTGDTSKK